MTNHTALATETLTQTRIEKTTTPDGWEHGIDTNPDPDITVIVYWDDQGDDDGWSYRFSLGDYGDRSGPVSTDGEMPTVEEIMVEVQHELGSDWLAEGHIVCIEVLGR